MIYIYILHFLINIFFWKNSLKNFDKYLLNQKYKYCIINLAN